MNYHKILTVISALSWLAFCAACEGEEESYDWAPAGSLHIIGDESVPALAEASYRVDGFTVENNYTWTLNGDPIEPTRAGEFVDITFEEPGEYLLAVSNGTLDDAITVAALPVTLGLNGNAATVAENSDTLNIPLNLSYEGGGTALAENATVGYTLGGTAVAGEDYTLLSPNPLTVEAGQEEAVIQVLLADDAQQEEAKTLTATLGSVTAEGTSEGITLTEADSLRTYTATIVNDQKLVTLVEPPVDTLSAATSAGAYIFEVMLSAPAASDVTVPYTVTGTGVDDLTGGEVTLLTGQTSSSIIVEVEPTAFTATQTIAVALSEVTAEDEEVTYETDEDGTPMGNTGTIVVVANE